MEWLRADDELPAKDEKVIIYDDKRMKIDIAEFLYDENGKPMFDSAISKVPIFANLLSHQRYGHVTHWTPLPKPPQQKK